MPIYNYAAKDKAGKQITGVVEAANDAAAISLIK